MVALHAVAAKVRPETAPEFDAIVIGAGVSGVYQLYKLRELGLRVRVFEAGTGVGGTWYWNRYPGARFDSESWTYGYSFSQELLKEWHWREHCAPHPETERYLNHVADKFDLRRDIQFNSRVASAHYQEETRSWDIALEDGRSYSTRFLLTVIRILSAPTMPNIPGVGTFKGQSCHTHAWPEQGVDFAGKRVGIIGTGATAVQTIQEIARTVGHLTVFQRTPNWCAPLHNGKISDAEMSEIQARYEDIFALCRTSPGCYIHAPDPRATLDVPPSVHNDYTVKSGPRRVRDLMGEEAEELLRHRFEIVNVWRPIRGPLRDAPLAVCDATSVAFADFVPSDLVYRDRIGETYRVRYNPAHRWFYVPEMRADEAVLIKCYDSAEDGRARFTAHSAFEDPTASADVLPRESIELRTLVFHNA